jgi:hypothetical protein
VNETTAQKQQRLMQELLDLLQQQSIDPNATVTSRDAATQVLALLQQQPVEAYTGRGAFRDATQLCYTEESVWHELGLVLYTVGLNIEHA